MKLLLGVIAVGLALIFGVMRVINFAHGDFVMVAMYVTYFPHLWSKIDPLLVIFAPIAVFVDGCFVVKLTCLSNVVDGRGYLLLL